MVSITEVPGRVCLTPAQQLELNNGGLVKNNNPMPGLQEEGFNEATRMGDDNGGNSDDKQINKNERNRVQYQLKGVIGKGSFGVVYKAINRGTGEIVAIKEVDYDNDEELNDIMAEIHLLKNLNHRNIVKYHGFIQKMDTLYIILEYCSKSSLKRLISPNKGITEADAKLYIKQTLYGLVYLHEQGVIHRDIKAANLLLDSEDVVKLADFGVSTKVSNATMAMTLAGSLNWMAPEIIGNRGASTLSDIWSLGATVVELLTGNPPFHNLVDVNIYYAIENEIYLPPENLISKEGLDFLSQCFQKNMYLRPTARQLLQHEWLNVSDLLPPLESNYSIDSPIAKLSKFKENFANDWNDDFTEKSVETSPIKRGSISPIKRTTSKLASVNLESLNSKNTMSEFSTENEGYLLQKVAKGQMVGNLSVLFNDCDPESICDSLFTLLNGSSTNNYFELVSSIIEFDCKYNNSVVKQKFVTIGGLSFLLDKPKILINCFIDCSDDVLPPSAIFRLLIQMGIMQNKYLDLITDAHFKLELILKYLDCTSLKYWLRWCSRNLDISMLLDNKNIHLRISQVIMLKLSSHASWFSDKFIKYVINNITPEQILSDSQTFYTLFKCITLILSGPLDLSNNSRPISTVNISPFNTLSRQTSAITNLDLDNNLNNFASSDIGISNHLVSEYINWHINIMNVKSNNIRLSSWKYYIKSTYKLWHQQKNSLNELINTTNFLSLILRMISKHSDKLIGPTLDQALVILVQLSSELEHDKIPPQLFNTAIEFTKIEKYVTSGMKIMLICFQQLLHQNLKIAQISPDLLSIDYIYNENKSNILIRSSDLIDPFYDLKDDNQTFGNFITTFTKLGSFSSLAFICYGLVNNAKFYDKLTSFFRTCRNSILLQIDLLKFTKNVLTRALQYNDDEMTLLKIDEIVAFLNHNWQLSANNDISSNTASSTNQVGFDSILIHQLCKDIELLSQGVLPANGDSTVNYDKDGFAIPKWTV